MVEYNKISIRLEGSANFSEVYSALRSLKAQINEVSKISSGLGRVSINTDSIKLAEKNFLATATAIKGVNVEMVSLSQGASHLNERLLTNNRTFAEMMGTYRSGYKNLSEDMKRIGEYQAKLHQSMVVPSAVGNSQAAVITNFGAMADKTLAAQKSMQAYNTEMANLGNKIVNFGKNTQWAGRQLMVGFTLPMLAAGGALTAMFMSVEKSMKSLMMVYGMGGNAGQGFSNMLPSAQELDGIRNSVMQLSQQMAAMYGQSAAVTAGVAADLAAAGYTQQQLLDLTKTATDAMVLGQTDQQSAIKATIAIQNAYRLSTKQTAQALEFFSAAQATTSTNMKDLIDAVPRVGPIVKNLGGTYKDTVAMLVAMKEGGVAAGEGANALKNSLQRIVAPTESAKKTLAQFKINLDDIAKSGSPVTMIEKLQAALVGLDSVSRQQAITELFGKFQAARMTALLDNFNRTGTQSAKVMQMMALSADELAKMQARQIEIIQTDPAVKFQAAIESLKATLLPIGQKIVELATPVVNTITWVVETFQKIGPLKYLLAGGLGLTAIIGPLIMFGGLISNLVGQIFKMSQQMRMFRQGFSEAGGLAKPLYALKEGLKATQNYLEDFSASEYASKNAADQLTMSAQEQAASFKELTKAMAEYREELSRIASGGPSGGPGGSFGPGPIGGVPGGYPRIPTGGPSFPSSIVGQASSPIYIESKNVLLTNDRNKLTGTTGTGELTFAHMRSKEETIGGSNILNIPGYDKSRNAQGTFGVVPGYLASEIGGVFNEFLQQKSHPIIPTGMNTPEMVRQILSEIGISNITEEMVKTMMQELSIESAGGVEAAKIATMQALSMLQDDPAFMKKFEKLGSRTNIEGHAADVEALFAEKLGPVWEQLKANASESVLKLYEQAQQEAALAIKDQRVAAPQNTAESLSLIAGRFSELISEQFIAISSTYSDKLIQSMTIDSPDIDRVTEQMKRKTAVKLVNAATTAESMMNPFIDALESLIQQTRGLVTQMTSEARMATSQIASMTARGAMEGIETIGRGRVVPRAMFPLPRIPLASGGKVYGPGGPKDDLIPALLSDGEYVVREDSVRHYGPSFLDSINNKKFASGGIARLHSGSPVSHEHLDPNNPNSPMIVGKKGRHTTKEERDARERQSTEHFVGDMESVFGWASQAAGTTRRQRERARSSNITHTVMDALTSMAQHLTDPYANYAGITGLTMAENMAVETIKNNTLLQEWMRNNLSDPTIVDRILSSGPELNQRGLNPVTRSDLASIGELETKLKIMQEKNPREFKKFIKMVGRGTRAANVLAMFGMSAGRARWLEQEGFEQLPSYADDKLLSRSNGGIIHALFGRLAKPDNMPRDKREQKEWAQNMVEVALWRLQTNQELQRGDQWLLENYGGEAYRLFKEQKAIAEAQEKLRKERHPGLYGAMTPRKVSNEGIYEATTAGFRQRDAKNAEELKRFEQQLTMETYARTAPAGYTGNMASGGIIHALFGRLAKPKNWDERREEISAKDRFSWSKRQALEALTRWELGFPAVRGDEWLIENFAKDEFRELKLRKAQQDAEQKYDRKKNPAMFGDEVAAKSVDTSGVYEATVSGFHQRDTKNAEERKRFAQQLAAEEYARTAPPGYTGNMANGGIVRAMFGRLAKPKNWDERQEEISPKDRFSWRKHQALDALTRWELGFPPVRGDEWLIENYAKDEFRELKLRKAQQDAQQQYDRKKNPAMFGDEVSSRRVDNSGVYEATVAGFKQRDVRNAEEIKRFEQELAIKTYASTAPAGYTGNMAMGGIARLEGGSIVSGIKAPFKKSYLDTGEEVVVASPLERLLSIVRHGYLSDAATRGLGISTRMSGQPFNPQSLRSNVEQAYMGINPDDPVRPMYGMLADRSGPISQLYGSLRMEIDPEWLEKNGIDVTSSTGDTLDRFVLDSVGAGGNLEKVKAYEAMGAPELRGQVRPLSNADSPKTLFGESKNAQGMPNTEHYTELQMRTNSLPPEAIKRHVLQMNAGVSNSITTNNLTAMDTNGIQGLSDEEIKSQVRKAYISQVEELYHLIELRDEAIAMGANTAIEYYSRIPSGNFAWESAGGQWIEITDLSSGIKIARDESIAMLQSFRSSIDAVGHMNENLGITKEMLAAHPPNWAASKQKEKMSKGEIGKSVGGLLSGFAAGGKAFGPGGPKDDLIPAMISNGEYVINADAVSHYGVGFIDAINAKKLAGGGTVGLAKGTGGEQINQTMEMFSYMLPDIVQMFANPQQVGFEQITRVFSMFAEQVQSFGDAIDPVTDSVRQFGDRQVIRAGIVMDDLSEASKSAASAIKTGGQKISDGSSKVTSSFMDMVGSLKEKYARQPAQSSAPSSSSITDSGWGLTIKKAQQASQSAYDDTREAKARAVFAELSAEADDSAKKLNKEKNEANENYEKVRAALDESNVTGTEEIVDVKNIGKTRGTIAKAKAGLSRVGGILNSSGGRMLGTSALSIGSSLLTEKLQTDAGGETAVTGALDYASQGAMMGSMFGPYGIAIGAIGGAAMGAALGHLAEEARDTAKAVTDVATQHQNYRDSIRVSSDAMNALGLQSKSFSDINFVSGINATDEFTAKVNELADAMTNGTDASKNMIATLKAGDEDTKKRTIAAQYLGTLQSGGDAKQAAQVAAAAAKAGGISGFQSQSYIQDMESQMKQYGGKGQVSLAAGAFMEGMKNAKSINMGGAASTLQGIEDARLKDVASRQLEWGSRSLSANSSDFAVGAQALASGAWLQGMMNNISQKGFGSIFDIEGSRQAMGVGETGRKDWIKELNLKNVREGFNINDLVVNRDKLRDMAKDKNMSGKDVFASGDQQLIDMATAAGLSTTSSIEEVAAGFDKMNDSLRELEGQKGAQQAIQTYAENFKDFQAQFVEPIESAMANLSTDDFSKSIDSMVTSMEKAGGNVQDLVDKVSKDMGPEFEKLGKEFGRDKTSAEAYLNSLALVRQGHFLSAQAAADAAQKLSMSAQLRQSYQDQTKYETDVAQVKSDLTSGIDVKKQLQFKSAEIANAQKAYEKQYAKDVRAAQDSYKAQQKAAQAQQQAEQDKFEAEQKARQEQVKAIQKEMDARQKLYDMKQKEIQQDQTLSNLENAISKARNSGDLLALAAAQSEYNNEIKRQNEEKAKQMADDADKSKIDKINADSEAAQNAYNERQKAHQKEMEAMQEAYDAKMQAMSDAHDAKNEKWGTQQEQLQRWMNNAEALGQKNAVEVGQLTDDISAKMLEHINDPNFKWWEDPEIKSKMNTISKDIGAGADVVGDKFKKIWHDVQKWGKEGAVKINADASVNKIGVPNAKISIDSDGTLKYTSNGVNYYDINGKATSAPGAASKDVGGAGAPGGTNTNAKVPAGATRAGFATGGHVRGPGNETSDSIPAMLSDGEYVVKAKSVKKYGTGFMDALNAGRYASGGLAKYVDGSPGGVSADHPGGTDGDPSMANSPAGNASGGPTGPGSAEAAANTIVALARKYKDITYSFRVPGLPDEGGWGCATSAYWLYKQVGVTLPSNALSQDDYDNLHNAVPRGAEKPADLMFYHNSWAPDRDINHVAIYLGGGEQFNGGNGISGINWSNWRGTRRVLNDGTSYNISGGGDFGSGGIGGGAIAGAMTQKILEMSDLTDDQRKKLLSTISMFGPASNIANSMNLGAGPATSMSGNANAPTGSGGSWLKGFLSSKGASGGVAKTLWAIAMRESNANPETMYPSGRTYNWDSSNAPYYDTGLFQINNRHLALVKSKFGADKNMMLMKDPNANYEIMKSLSNGFTDWNAWGIGRDGISADWTGWPSTGWDKNESFRQYMNYRNQYDSLRLASGGKVFGAGGPTEDKIPAMLSNGEYVVKSESVKKYGVGFMDSVNAGKYATGGIVRHFEAGGSAEYSNQDRQARQYAARNRIRNRHTEEHDESTRSRTKQYSQAYNRFGDIDYRAHSANVAAGSMYTWSDILAGRAKARARALARELREERINRRQRQIDRNYLLGFNKSFVMQKAKEFASPLSLMYDAEDTYGPELGSRRKIESKMFGNLSLKEMFDNVVQSALKSNLILNKIENGKTLMSQDQMGSVRLHAIYDQMYRKNQGISSKVRSISNKKIPFETGPGGDINQFLLNRRKNGLPPFEKGMPSEIADMIQEAGFIYGLSPFSEDYKRIREDKFNNQERVGTPMRPVPERGPGWFMALPGITQNTSSSRKLLSAPASFYTKINQLAEGVVAANVKSGKTSPADQNKEKQAVAKIMSAEYYVNNAKKVKKNEFDINDLNNYRAKHGMFGSVSPDAAKGIKLGASDSHFRAWWRAMHIAHLIKSKKITTEAALNKAINEENPEKELNDIKIATNNSGITNRPGIYTSMSANTLSSQSLLPARLQPAFGQNRSFGETTVLMKDTITSTVQEFLNNLFSSGFVKTLNAMAQTGLAAGGSVTGPGGPKDDKIAARLSNGEFVMSAAAVDKYGVDVMNMVNAGKLNPKFVGPRRMANNLSASDIPQQAASNNNIEYNVNVNVEGTNATPEDIARVVIRTLKQKEQTTVTHRRMG